MCFPRFFSKIGDLRATMTASTGDGQGRDAVQSATTSTKIPFGHPPYYGTFSPSPSAPPSPCPYNPPSVAYHAIAVGCPPLPYQVQQVFVEGLPLREPPLPFCGIGVGWALFLLGFFLAAIPWYAGAFILFFVASDHREKPGLIACTIVGIVALVPFILYGIRMHPFW